MLDRLEQLFPIDRDTRKRAVHKLMRLIQFVQAVFVLIVVLVQGEYTLLTMLIPVAVYIVSELTLRMGKN
ncbi:hypothetical protein [Bacillus sp. FJAT-22090]|uniref:hypothetical protein n=1 Tax=Bacillus sp. FJAT-22090 TaxID=1581038 RepID=UPI0011A007FC|nr:hypothetical protein [Bacillus sp. FJAT-22090]